MSLMEVTIGSAILAVSLFASYSLFNIGVAGLQKDRQSFQLQREHHTLKGLLSGLRADTARSAFCEPHPYQSFVPNKGCVNGPETKRPSKNDLNAVEDLSKTVFDWAAQSVLAKDVIDPALGQASFHHSVTPKLLQANCRSCHDGSNRGFFPPRVNKRDFTKYEEVANESGLLQPLKGTLQREPLATRAMFTSPFGRKLLRPTLSLNDLFFRSRQVEHRVVFSAQAVGLESTDLRKEFLTTTVEADAQCPGPCGPDEVLASCSTTVSRTCTKGSGKSAVQVPCEWRRDWQCAFRASAGNRDTIRFILTSIQRDLRVGQQSTGQVSRISSEGILQ